MLQDRQLTLTTYQNVDQHRKYINSSEIRGLDSMKCSSEMLQNQLYFMYKKTHVVFFFSLLIFTTYLFLLSMPWSMLTDIDQSFHQGTSKVAQKNYLDFHIYTKNIANFEAFCWIISLCANLIFLKGAQQIFKQRNQ